ncbi:MAG: DUF4258 domain-containing protein [SAR324 cluster bacterium]|nr:DUF4258 domain-containing protein [SAR324 cluster bacterium]
MKCKNIKYSNHAIQRMFERSISTVDVSEVIQVGEIINQYPDDKPYPSFLLLGFIETRPIHVLVAVDEELDFCYTITVYIPKPGLWTENFKTKRKK